MKKYTTIFWDLDQTLLNFDLSMEHALRAVFGAYGLAVSEEIETRYDAINRSYWLRLESGGADQGTSDRGAFPYLI